MEDAKLIEKLNRIKLLADECLRDLVRSEYQREVKPPAKSKKAIATRDMPDFSLPMRPFVKRYVTGLSGPKKFTLLTAYLVSEDTQREVTLADIERAWNSMTSLMGMKFNRFFSQQAKDNGWVETKKKGVYTLRPSWIEIL